MEQNSQFSEILRKYLSLFWHWSWLLALATVLAASATYFVNSRMTPVYRAGTRLLVSEAPTSRSNEYQSLLYSERLARTYKELIMTDRVLSGVIASLSLDSTTGQLRQAIAVTLVPSTLLIDFTVENVDPVLAADIANTLGDVFSQEIAAMETTRYADSKENLLTQMTDIEAQIAELQITLTSLGTDEANQADRVRLETIIAQNQEIYTNLLQSYENIRFEEAQSTQNVVQVGPAVPPKNPIRPKVMMNTMIAAVVGFAFAVFGIIVVEALDDTVKGPDDVNRKLGLPVLALIAQVPETEGGPITFAEPRSPVAEAFRSLRTNIQFASVDKPLQTLLITSPMPKDGKSTISTNVAVVLAQSGKKVTIIDADLRRPTLHKKLNMTNRRGLTDLFVQQKLSLEGIANPTGVPNLKLLTSGGLPPNPSELIGSSKMMEIVSALHEVNDVVIIDTPPVMAVTDSSILAPKVDGVLLVIRPGETKMAAAKQTVEQLRRVNANILGAVLNDVENKRARYYYYYKGYYAYNYYYGDDGTKKRGLGRFFGKKKAATLKKS